MREDEINELKKQLSELTKKVNSLQPEQSDLGKFDWKKVSDGVLVKHDEGLPFRFNYAALIDLEGLKLDTEHWQAWIGGDCPLPDCVWVLVRYRSVYLSEKHIKIASDFNWGHNGEGSDIICFKVIRLADGIKY